MGFLKILFIFLLILYVIHLFIKRLENKALNFLKNFQEPHMNSSQPIDQTPLTEKMVVCAKCGVFNPRSLSVQSGSKFYCSGGCDNE